MASRDPFNIGKSPVVAPIPCVDCGNNTHCVRRQPTAEGERQLFICAACGGSSERTVRAQQSDTDVQREAERQAGLLPRTRANDAGTR